VRLIGVTKTVGVDEIEALYGAGVRDVGENRPQQLEKRAGEVAASCPDLNWHLIGHLQRNKIRKVWPLAACIHSLDSERLARALGKERQKRQKQDEADAPACLVEVNVAGESQKTGLQVDDLEAVLAACRGAQLPVRGLMTMAPFDIPEPEQRRTFAALRELRDVALTRGWAESLPELSMGMTDDFEAAIKEGATMVRIGRALFR
jgi:hypothetical protein